MPNCRKHSESRLREGSCRSTKAARARSFLEEDKGTREFPKAISCDRSCAGYFVRRQGSSRPTLSSSRPSGYGVTRPMPPKRHSGAGFAPRQSRKSTVTGTKVLLPEVTRSPSQLTTRCHQGNDWVELNRKYNLDMVFGAGILPLRAPRARARRGDQDLDASSPSPRLHSTHRLNSSAPFVPPKPKEFDMAYSTEAWRGWFGTKSMAPVPGSWFSRLMVGGSI